MKGRVANTERRSQAACMAPCTGDCLSRAMCAYYAGLSKGPRKLLLPSSAFCLLLTWRDLVPATTTPETEGCLPQGKEEATLL